MDHDKAIRSAKLTLGGMLEKKRAKSAVERAQGQIAPSKYLPGVPRAVHANGGEVADLGQAREQKQLQTFSKNMRTDINQRVNSAMEAHQKALDAGVFDGYEVGDVLKGSAHPMRITGRFMRKWKPTPMTLGAFDRMGTKPTIIEHEGEQYIPMLRYETGVEGQDGWQSGDAYLDGVKAAGYQKMGGLRAVKAGGGRVAFQQGNHPLVPDVLYHGNAPKIATKGWTDEVDEEQTQKNIDAQDFRTFRPSYYGNYGEGIYLSDSPKIASDYAQGLRADQSEVKPHGQVMKLHVSMKQPFTDDALRHPAWIDYIKGEINQALDWRSGRRQDVSEKEMADALIKKLDNGTATVRDLFLRDTPEGTMVNQFGQDRIHKTIRNSGFDGIIAHRPDGSKEYVAFKPEQVKSALSAKTYDPTNPDMTFADGGAVPQKTVKAYKLFRTKGDGKLYPLFVNADKPVPMGEWIDAEEGPQGKAQGRVKSKIGDLAYRPGWHAGDLPVATHIGGKSSPDLKAPDYRPDNHVWAEVEMPNDVDWQSEANARAKINKAGQPILNTAHITDQLPKGGFYRYKTNPNMTGNWLIGGSMKVNRVLSDEEVKAINDQAGVADLPRRSEGFAAGGAAMFEGMSEHLMDDEGKPMELWHGTPGAGFEAFDDAKLGNRDAGFYGRGHYLTPIKGNAEGYADPDEMGTGTVMGPLHAALKNPYIWDTSDAGSHRTLRDLQSMGIMKGQKTLSPWDNLQRHHIDPFMREMQKRGHDGVIVRMPDLQGDRPHKVTEVVVFNPNMIKHRDAEVFDPNDPRIMRADGGRTLYSRAAEIIRSLPQEKGTVDQYIAAAKARGAKPSELEHAGRPEGDKITREEMAKHFESRLPNLKIEQYGENPTYLTRDESRRRVALQDRAVLGRGEPLTPEEQVEYNRLTHRSMSSPNEITYTDDDTGNEEYSETNYGDYTLPGGTNYRERLLSLRLPKDPRDDFEKKLKKAEDMARAWPEGHPRRQHYAQEAFSLRQQLDAMPPRQQGAPYQSSHWSGHPNVLAHIRLTDRTVGEDRESLRPIAEKLAAGLGVGIRDLASGAASVGIQNKIITPEEAASLSRLMGWRNGYDQARGIGKRLLHVEELQSDWAQEGRDKGFHDPKNPYEIFETKTGKTVSKHPTYEAMWDAFRSMPDEQSAGLDYGSAAREKPAEAPYVTNTQHWTDLALKNVLREAALGNYDGIVFTPGQAQADRYGLEKQLDTLAYYPGSNRIAGYKDEYNVFQKDDVKPEDLAAHVGKEVAERLLDQSNARNIGTEDQVHVLQGNDLKAGGLGMKGYYDNIVPKSVLRLAQQHDPEAKASGPIDLGGGYQGFHLPMTDTLKNSIIDKGFPAMRRGGSVDRALAITRGFTKDGRAATMQLKAKGD